MTKPSSNAAARGARKGARRNAAAGSPSTGENHRAGSSQPQGATAAPPTALDPANAERAARIVWVSLALIAAARLAFTFAPGHWAWSLDAQRYLPPLAAWAPWAFAALALAPPVARAVLPVVVRLGDAVADAPWRAAAAWALVAALGVWAAPDRLYFVGDFIMRQGSALGNISTDLLFPQALPLDLFVHHTLPRLAASLGGDVSGFERALGAVEAGLLAALAVAFANALGLRGAAAFAAVTVVVFGGYLTIFTGLGKAFRELCVLSLATGVAALRVARDGRGFAWLAAAGGLAMLFHRSAMMLLPGIAAAAVTGARRDPRMAPRAIAAAVFPAVVLALSLPRILSAMKTIDAAHLAPGGSGLAFAAPLHLADVANTVLALSPLALPAALAAVLVRLRLRLRSHAWVLVAFASLAAVLIVVVQPRQGMFRDQDVFAAAAVVSSMAAAWAIGRALQAAPRYAWLALPVALAALVPTAQALAIATSPAHGLARIEAFLDGPPVRDEGERATGWHYASTRYAMLDRLDDAAVAAARAAELAPSPRLLYEWGEAERARGRDDAALGVYRKLVERAPTFALAWRRLGETALALGDLKTALEGASYAQSLEPEGEETQALVTAVSAAYARRDSAGAPR